jgi:hypothetical protein
MVTHPFSRKLSGWARGSFPTVGSPAEGWTQALHGRRQIADHDIVEPPQERPPAVASLPDGRRARCLFEPARGLARRQDEMKTALDLFLT